MRLALPLLLIVLLLCAFAGHAQSPPGINYQGVARNFDGKPLTLKDITIKINIVRDGENGPVEYSEIHTLKTNSFGLFTLVIGNGTVVSGDFLYISWAMGNKWLRVEMDPDGGSRFQIMGSQQFMSVPYAFYAKYSGNSTPLTPGPGISIANNVISNIGDADNSTTNELNTAFSLSPDFKLRLTDSGGTKEADLGPLATQQSLGAVLTLGNDAGAKQITNLGEPAAATDAATKAYVDSKAGGDPSSTNELQNLSSSAVGTSRTINITDGTSTTIDVADNDNNPTNEIQSLSSTVVGTNRTINISGGGLPTTIDVADNDNSPTNEIQNLSSIAVGTNRTISISGGGASTIIDVADNDNSATNEIQTMTLNTISNQLSLSGSPAVDLTPYRDNTDSQDLQLSGNALSLTGDATPVNLSTFMDNTDEQALSLSGTTLSLTNGGSVNLDDLLDNTDSQDLERSGNSLSLSGDGTPVDLTPFMDNTDNQNLSVGVSGNNRTINITGGTGATFSVADSDSDQTNEIQSLTYTPATRNLSISMGNSVILAETQNIAQVLTVSNDAGGQRITNLGGPTANSDAVTKQYVDNADAAITARLNINYAFKTGFAFSTLLTGGSNIPLPLSGEQFDDFNVVNSANFTAQAAGTYVFTVDGDISSLLVGSAISILYNGTKYPVSVGSNNRYNTTLMFRMTVGQTVSLVADGLGVATNINGTFFGYKLP